MQIGSNPISPTNKNNHKIKLNPNDNKFAITTKYNNNEKKKIKRSIYMLHNKL